MKKFAVLLCLALLCVGFTYVAAQSRRTSPSSSTNGKPNQRPEPKATPTPDASTTATTEQPESGPPVFAADDTDVIRVDTSLVTIPVKVSDRQNKFSGGLKKEDFRVFEDDVEQEIAYFSNEEQPFTVALVLDMSYSTKFKIAEIQHAAIAFIGQLREQDKLAVISFDEEVHVLCTATNDRQKIYQAIRSTKIGTGTSLYDAMDQVMNDGMKRISGRKAIVLFTDGVDTTSRLAHDMSNIRDAMETDALIYPIRYDTYADVQAMNNGQTVTKIPIPGTGGGTVTTGSGNPGGIPPSTTGSLPFPIPDPTAVMRGGVNSRGTTEEDYRNAEKYLRDLAVYTGGTMYLADTTANMNAAFSRIASELREFYSLGYYPKDEGTPGKKKKIKVRLAKAGLAVRARDSYVVGKKLKKGK